MNEEWHLESHLDGIQSQNVDEDFLNSPKLTVYCPTGFIAGNVNFDAPAKVERGNFGFTLAKTKGLSVRFQYGLPVIDAHLTVGKEYLLVFHEGGTSRTYYGHLPKFEFEGLTMLTAKAVECGNFKEGRLTEFFGYCALFKILDSSWKLDWHIQCPYNSIFKEFSISSTEEGVASTPVRTVY